MKTYLVRTKTDQTLVGLFCATSPRTLAQIIEELVEPAECEYLVLRANEGLFVEAQFVQAPAATASAAATVFLTNAPADYIPLDEEEDFPEAHQAALQAQPGSELEHAMSEVIPPVLEPTEDLQRRLQSAQREGWLSFGKKEVSKPEVVAPRTSTPILVLGGQRTVH